MFLRINYCLWRLSAQSKGKTKVIICLFNSWDYYEYQRSSHVTLLAHYSDASPVLAKAVKEMIRSPRWFDSFISPLLGPFRKGVWVLFLSALRDLIFYKRSKSFLTYNGGCHV